MSTDAHHLVFFFYSIGRPSCLRSYMRHLCNLVRFFNRINSFKCLHWCNEYQAGYACFHFHTIHARERSAMPIGITKLFHKFTVLRFLYVLICWISTASVRETRCERCIDWTDENMNFVLFLPNVDRLRGENIKYYVAMADVACYAFRGVAILWNQNWMATPGQFFFHNSNLVSRSTTGWTKASFAYIQGIKDRPNWNTFVFFSINPSTFNWNAKNSIFLLKLEILASVPVWTALHSTLLTAITFEMRSE